MSFFLVTLRRLLRERYYALLCIFSLALGIGSALLIALYLYSELTFDHYHPNHARLYRVTTNLNEVSIPMSGYDTGPTLARDNPQLLAFTRISSAVENRFSYGELGNSWENVKMVDTSAFDLFGFKPLRGDVTTAFADPYTIAVSESLARYYFGDTDPIGQLLSTDRLELRVTLVFEDLPENVSQQFDALLPFQLLEVYEPDYLESFSSRFLSGGDTQTYFLTAADFDADSMAEISREFYENYVAASLQSAVGNVADIAYSVGIQRMSDIHFDSPMIGNDTAGSILNIYIFSATAIALLVISCINYINLATARAAARSKEVALKKLLGADARDLIWQFIAESVVFIGIAFVLGILLALLMDALGLVAAVSGKTQLISLLLTPQSIGLCIAAGFIISLFTGIYPAINLSRPSMMHILRPTHNNWRRGLPIRQALVFLQIAATMVIITCVFVMLRQTDYLMSTPLGFAKENQLIVELQGADAIRAREPLMNELRSHPEILSVVETSRAFGRGLSISILPVEDNNGENQLVTINPSNFGAGALEAMEMQLLQGNMFRMDQSGSEIGQVIVNETFVRHMQWQQPIGKRIGRSEVVGVVRDFHYLPLHEPIAPVYIAPYNDGYLDSMRPSQQATTTIDLIIKVTGNDLTATREFIVEKVDQFSAQDVVEIKPLDVLWKELYDDDTQTTGLVGLFAGISVAISLLGLAGLAAYSNLQRSKEIAIRKVLGATIASILSLLSLSMLRVIACAIVPGMAGAYYVSNQWLERFAYRAEFSVLPYIIAVLAVLFVSIAVMLIQTYRTAQSNPMSNLRYE